ncbi:MAG TPA: helix-turn-helix domain-containing protein [Stellaceae bacterium]|nr:helix-turn-helix domain-containing protein [Stellaceae bacterium]
MSGLVDIATAEELAAWMKRMNLSLTAAAEQLGRKRATIARYIKGETPLPESVARHAAVIEAARNGRPFDTRRRNPRLDPSF